MRFWAVALLFLAEIKNAQAQPISREFLKDTSFVRQLSQAIDSVYNLSFESARVILKTEGISEEHPFHTFWEAWETWWLILTDLSDTQRDKAFFEMLESAEQHAGRWLDQNPNHQDALMVKILANGFFARHSANRGHWVRSVKHARAAQLTISELEKIYPDHPDLLFSDGMFNYYFELIPERFPSTRMILWMAPDGNKELGLAQIDSAFHNGVFLPNEAAYFLANIYMKYEKKPSKSLEYVRHLQTKFPNNGFYVRYGLKVFFLAKDYDEVRNLALIAIQKFSKSNRHHALTREWAYLYLGRVAMRQDDLEQAKWAFRNSYALGTQGTEKEENESIPFSAYHLGFIYDKFSNPDSAKHWYEIAKNSKTDSPYVRLAKKKLSDL